MNRVPTIANPKIKFELETKRKTHVYPGGPSGLESGITFSTEYLQNAGYETSIIAKQNPVFFYRKKVCHPGGREIVCTELYDMDYTYTLLPGEGYEVIGQSSFSN